MKANWKFKLVVSAVIAWTSAACTAQSNDEFTGEDGQGFSRRHADEVDDATSGAECSGAQAPGNDDGESGRVRVANATVPQTKAELEAALSALETAHRQLLIQVREAAKQLLGKPYIEGQFYREKVIMPMLKESDNLMSQHSKLAARLSAMTCGKIAPRVLSRFAGFFRLCGACTVGAIGEVLLNPGTCQAGEPDFCSCETAQMDADNVGYSYINECKDYHEKWGGSMSYPPTPGSFFGTRGHLRRFKIQRDDCKDLADAWVRMATRRDQVCLR